MTLPATHAAAYLWPMQLGPEASDQIGDESDLELNVWPKIGDGQRRELLNQLQINREKGAYGNSFISFLDAVRRLGHKKKNKDQSAKEKRELISKGMTVCYPRDLARVRPFLPTRIPASRYDDEQSVTHERITHKTSWGTVTYQGPCVYTADELLLLHLLYIADKTLTVNCNMYGLCNGFANRDDINIYRFVRKSLDSLLDIRIEISAGDRHYAAFHIIESFIISAETGRMRIKINPWFAEIYAAKLTTIVDLAVLKTLPEAGKAIYIFLSSHRGQEWWGSWDQMTEIARIGEGQKPARRRQFVKEAINTLVGKGLLVLKKGNGDGVHFKLNAPKKGGGKR